LICESFNKSTKFIAWLKCVIQYTGWWLFTDSFAGFRSFIINSEVMVSPLKKIKQIKIVPIITLHQAENVIPVIQALSTG